MFWMILLILGVGTYLVFQYNKAQQFAQYVKESHANVTVTLKKGIVLLIGIFSLACGKKGSDVQPKYFVNAEINGESFFYDSSVDDHLVQNSGSQAGYSSFFLFVSPKEFTSLSFGTVTRLTGKPESVKIDFGTYNKSRYEKYATILHQPDNGMCTITKIDDFVVEGTFYFDVYSDEGEGNNKLMVRNGRFRMPY